MKEEHDNSIFQQKTTTQPEKNKEIVGDFKLKNEPNREALDTKQDKKEFKNIKNDNQNNDENNLNYLSLISDVTEQPVEIFEPFINTSNNTDTQPREFMNSSSEVLTENITNNNNNNVKSQSTTYSVNQYKKNYRYINDDELMKNFNICSNYTNKFTTHFCIYSINTECYIEGNSSIEYNNMDFHDTQYIYNNFQPFIQYILEKKNDSIFSNELYTFPKSEYNCNVFSNSETQEKEEVEKTQEQIHFENFCLEFILSCFDKKFIDIIHTEKINIYNFYKGFIQDNDNPEDLYVFFDTTEIIKYLNKQKYTIAIIDEIVYKKLIYSTPINEIVTSFFNKNDFLTKIYLLNEDDDGELEVLFPFQLYLCNYKDGVYSNVEKTVTPLNSPSKTEDDDYGLTILNIEPFEHPFLGLAYFFSTFPINKYDTENLKRYSCFMVKELYLKKDINLVKEDIVNDEIETVEEDFTKDDIIGASTVYFHENELQLWAIKNIIHFIDY